ncbi:MAG: nickel-dependent lactate racemase [Treponemataceae bacterium]
MKIELGFEKTVQFLTVEDTCIESILLPNEISSSKKTEEEIIITALLEPIGSQRVGNICKKGEKIVIITSDITRPLPSYKLIKPLLNELVSAGIALEDITIVFALGSHRNHTEQEMRTLVGDSVFESVKCVDSNGSFVRLGVTEAGMPVEIFDIVANADRRICLGNIEYHYFAGYSGGAKAIMPGVSTHNAIQHNHSKMILDSAKAGRLEGNPIREDIDEVNNFCPIDFILNVVLDEHKKIIFAVAGHYLKAHREGCKFLDTLYGVPIKEKADIVVVSAGGFPKDINLYQAQKALDNAKHAVKDGGIIILCASCKEGLGEKTFEKWLLNAKSPEDWVNKIKVKFELGGHKATAIGLVMQKAEICLVSDLDTNFVRSIFFTPFSSVQAAFDYAQGKKGNDAKVLIMPYGSSTLPYLK